MANLYEYTITMQYVRDLVFLDFVDESDYSETWNEEMLKLPKNSGPIDDGKTENPPSKASKSKKKST
jgi:hypothetical protein